MKMKKSVCWILGIAAFSVLDIFAAIPPPPTGGNDLTVEIVPSWAKVSADDGSVRKAVFPAFKNPSAIWRAPGVIELPAEFSRYEGSAAVWDVNCPIDFSKRAGLEFDFYCEDISQFSQIRFFLRAGNGWYSVWPFAPEKEKAWCRIRFAKADFGKEGAGGKPGFDKIDGFRIAGWRNGNRDVALGFANLSFTDTVSKKLTAEEIAARDAKAKEWVRQLPPKKGEWRAFWCHPPFGMGGDPNTDWDRSIKALKENGFTAIVPCMAWSSCANYKSEMLAPSPAFKERGDQLDACLAACRKYGIELHVWKMCWHLGGKRAESEFAAKMRKRGLMQVTSGGQVCADALCPSDPEVLKHEVASFVEIAKKGVDGIHLDHIRTESTTCFCQGCRNRFEKLIGREFKKWPEDMQKDDAMMRRWYDFRADCVSELVRQVSEAVRNVAPGVKISAAVFSNPASDKVSIGQDWPRWCRMGWVDMVCPMNYTVSPLLLKSMVEAQKAAAGDKVKVFPGLGISLWPKGTDTIRVAGEQIETVRNAGLDGMIFFNYAAWHLPQLEALRQGPFAEVPDKKTCSPAIGYMLDVSRNKVPTMPTMRRIVDIISRMGYNQLQLYFEHAFAYKGYEAAWQGVSPFTPAEVRELDGYCRDRGIELVPNQNSFGHLENWFEHMEYRHLAELPEGGVRFAWGGRTHEPRALCPTSPKTFAFLDDLYSQLLPCFGSRYFNVGCDEVHDICEPVGRSAAVIKEKGEARVFLDYLNDLDRLVKKHGRVMMYWADGVMNRNAAFRAEVPKDAIALVWAYEHVNNIAPALGRLKESGIPFYFCPGSSNWLSLSGRYDNMKSNVFASVAHAKQYGAQGYLMTDWGDGGHCRPWLASLPSLILMRACISGEKLTDAMVAAEVDRITGVKCGEALIRYQRLDRFSGIPWKYNHSETYNMLSDGEDYFRPAAVTDAKLTGLFAEWRDAKATLRLDGAQPWVRDGFELMDLMYEVLELRWRARHREVASKVPRYRELWLKYNRPGGLEKSIAKNFGIGTSRGFQTLPPPAPRKGEKQVEGWLKATESAAAAKASVKPSQHTPNVRWRRSGAVELPVVFSGNPVEELSWTFEAPFEQVSGNEIAFDFYCEHQDRIAGARLEFLVGGKWISSSVFKPEVGGYWRRIALDIENLFGGGRIGKAEAMRIVVKRAKDRNTVLAMANMVQSKGNAK